MINRNRNKKTVAEREKKNQTNLAFDEIASLIVSETKQKIFNAVRDIFDETWQFIDSRDFQMLHVDVLLHCIFI